MEIRQAHHDDLLLLQQANLLNLPENYTFVSTLSTHPATHHLSSLADILSLPPYTVSATTSTTP